MNPRLTLVLAVLALAGCANDPAPNEQMRLTVQAVEQARAVGADPQLEEMREAERKLARAEKNMGEEDYKRARVFAEQADGGLDGSGQGRCDDELVRILP